MSHARLTTGFATSEMECKTTDGVLRINYIDRQATKPFAGSSGPGSPTGPGQSKVCIYIVSGSTRSASDVIIPNGSDCRTALVLSAFRKFMIRHGDPELARDVTTISFGSGCRSAAAQHDAGCAEPGYQQYPRLWLGYPSYRRRRHTRTAVTASAAAAVYPPKPPPPPATPPLPPPGLKAVSPGTSLPKSPAGIGRIGMSRALPAANDESGAARPSPSPPAIAPGTHGADANCVGDAR